MGRNLFLIVVGWDLVMTMVVVSGAPMVAANETTDYEYSWNNFVERFLKHYPSESTETQQWVNLYIEYFSMLIIMCIFNIYLLYVLYHNNIPQKIEIYNSIFRNQAELEH